jgi:sporulation protein YabP
MSRKSVSVTGVSRIAGFDDTQIEAETSVGLLFIRGEELVINNFDAESGELSLSGTINGMVYGKREKDRGFFARLLK